MTTRFWIQIQFLRGTAVIPNATVHLANDVSQFERTTTTDATGQFNFSNVPFNPYRIDVAVKGFANLSQNVEIRSSVGINVKLIVQISGGNQTVTVEAAGDLIENDPTFHVDVDRDLFTKVPLMTTSVFLSSSLTAKAPLLSTKNHSLKSTCGNFS